MNRVELYGEGKFTEYGELVVVRGGRLVRMECPMSGFSSGCKSCCPLLGEPEVVGDRVKLVLCSVTLEFISFVDERIV